MGFELELQFELELGLESEQGLQSKLELKLKLQLGLGLGLGFELGFELGLELELELELEFKLQLELELELGLELEPGLELELEQNFTKPNQTKFMYQTKLCQTLDWIWTGIGIVSGTTVWGNEWGSDRPTYRDAYASKKAQSVRVRGCGILHKNM